MSSTILIIAIFLAVYLQAKLQKLPLHPDTGLFIYRAQLENAGITLVPKLIPNGDKRYYCAEGCFPTKPKAAVYFLVKLLLRYCRGGIKQYRLYYGFYNALSTIMLYITTTLYFDNMVGALTALLYALYSASPYTDTSQLHAENYGILFVLLALLGIYLGRLEHCLVFCYFAGVLMGLLVMFFKITYLFETAALGIPLCWPDFQLSAFGAYFFGVASLVGSTITNYWLRGWLPFFFAWFNLRGLLNYRHIPARCYGRSPTPALSNLFSAKYFFFAAQTGVLWFGTLAGLYVNYKDILTFPKLIIICAALGALLSIAVQGKYYLAHFFALVPYITIFSAYGNIQLIINGHTTLLTISIILLVCSLITLIPYLIIFNPLVYFLKLYHTLKHDCVFGFLAAELIAAYINQNTIITDKILVWGYNAEVYGLARRRAALGYLEYPLCCEPVINDNYFGKEWQSWVVEAVAQGQPKYIVDLDGSLNLTALAAASGLTYRLENLFYGLFPLYVLDSAESRQDFGTNSLPVASVNLVNQDSEIKTKIITLVRWFQSRSSRFRIQEFPQEVQQLFRDWCSLNDLAYPAISESL